MKGSVAVKHSQSVLYSLFWQHVLVEDGHLLASSIKFLKSTGYNYVKK
jgi:hypothetical protein